MRIRHTLASVIIGTLLAGRDDMFFRTLGHQNPDARDIASHLHKRLGIAQVLLQAISSRQPGEHLKQTLLRIRRFEGLQQPIVFDDFGDNHSRFYPMVVSDGRFVGLE